MKIILFLVILSSYLQISYSETCNESLNCTIIRSLQANPISPPTYPKGFFNQKQISNGVFILYIVGKFLIWKYNNNIEIGTLYMFLALWHLNRKYYYVCIEDILSMIDVKFNFFSHSFFEFLCQYQSTRAINIYSRNDSLIWHLSL